MLILVLVFLAKFDDYTVVLKKINLSTLFRTVYNNKRKRSHVSLYTGVTVHFEECEGFRSSSNLIRKGSLSCIYF